MWHDANFTGRQSRIGSQRSYRDQSRCASTLNSPTVARLSSAACEAGENSARAGGNARSSVIGKFASERVEPATPRSARSTPSKSVRTSTFARCTRKTTSAIASRTGGAFFMPSTPQTSGACGRNGEPNVQKIISLFQRNYESDRLVRDEIVPGAEWVAAGEGTATRKMDGTCCMVRGGKLFKRYELKSGRKAPDGFEGAQPADPVTGDIPGWVPVGEGTEDRWHREAFAVTIFPRWHLRVAWSEGARQPGRTHGAYSRASRLRCNGRRRTPRFRWPVSDSLRSPILK